ncbi:unnamed protein product [Lettuce chlorosis virus]|jgi:hypothetical protein|uniref:ORF10 n=1 Tax=Lettuce chlorosis virus TaxID=642478 RepID=C6FJ66_9CLOS|nr:unnamed protein product [Lettuce chlorosis virus]ACQ82517.1 p4.8 [Lettuce chlorosis virus]QEM20987.1 ORF10 p4.8 [Lettuce chlorosis virus]QNS31423.1 ORF10 [Lettuce chlorosis virus]
MEFSHQKYFIVYKIKAVSVIVSSLGSITIVLYQCDQLNPEIN